MPFAPAAFIKWAFDNRANRASRRVPGERRALLLLVDQSLGELIDRPVRVHPGGAVPSACRVCTSPPGSPRIRRPGRQRSRGAAADEWDAPRAVGRHRLHRHAPLQGFGGGGSEQGAGLLTPSSPSAASVLLRTGGPSPGRKPLDGPSPPAWSACRASPRPPPPPPHTPTPNLTQPPRPAAPKAAIPNSPQRTPSAHKCFSVFP